MYLMRNQQNYIPRSWIVLILMISTNKNSFCVLEPSKASHTTQTSDMLSLGELHELCHQKGNRHSSGQIEVVSLHSNEVDGFLRTLNTTTKQLDISLKPTIQGNSSLEVDFLNITYLQFLNVEELWITSVLSKDGIHITRNILPIIFQYHQSDGRNLNLKRLYLKLYTNSGETNHLVDLISNSHLLEVFHINGYNIDIKPMMMALAGKPLKVLNVDGFQNKYSPGHISNFNFDEIMGPLSGSPLQCISILDNDIVSLTAGLAAIAPLLQLVFIPGDASLNIVLAELTFFHPNIVEIYVKHNEKYDKFRMIKKRSPATKRLSSCLSKENITFIEVLTDPAAMCKILHCWIDLIHSIPCRDFPSPKILESLLDSSCYGNVKIPLSEKLEVISVSDADRNVYFTASPQYFNDTKPLCFHVNNLKTIIATDSPMYSNLNNIGGTLKHVATRGLENLTELNLANNKIKMNLHQSKFLSSLKGLKVLDLSGNMILLEPESGLGSLCQSLKDLKVIKLSDNHINTVPVTAFRECTQLQEIHLDRNALTSVSLPRLMALSFVNVSKNDILYFDKSTREMIDRLKSVTFDFSSNQFICDCSTDGQKTVTMVKSNDYKFRGVSSYTCVYKGNVNQNILELKENYCDFYTIPVIGAFAGLCTIFILVSIVCLMYKYRFRIYYLYQRMKNRVKQCRSEEQGEQTNHQFDIFVSYCSEDRFWVHDLLMKVLENKYGFNLCIHLRDFKLGEYIDNEIERNMSLSKINLFVISNNSVQKMWPQFELRCAVEQQYQGKPLIIIKYGPITYSRNEMSPFVKQILDAKVYVEWPEETHTSSARVARKKSLFWNRLVGTIYSHLLQTSMANLIFDTLIRRNTRHSDLNASTQCNISETPLDDRDDVMLM